MPAPEGRRNARPFAAFLKVLLVAGLVLGANYAFDQLQDALKIDIRPSNEDMIHRIVMTAAVFYVITLAIPFVPGVEIGLGLMALLGSAIVPLVYLCTIAGLSLAFFFGRLVPLTALIDLCRDLRLARAEDMLRRFQSVLPPDKLFFLLSASSSRATFWLLRHRYIALALLINMPGNFLIGGGGGIAMIAGASRLFRWHLFVLTVAVAVAPVPLAILILGPSILAH